MFETTFDKMMYPVGFKTTVEYPIRKWKDRPPLTVGQPVTITQLDWKDNGYGPIPRILVETEDGKQRWIDASSVVPCRTGNKETMARLNEIATEFFARRD